MRHDTEAIEFMKNILEEVGYDIDEDPEQPGWSWSIETAACQTPLETMGEAVSDAWASAADYVRDMLGGHTPADRWRGQWEAMSVGQQAKLILLSFDDDEEGTALSDGLFQAIRENDLLKTTLRTLGGAIETGDTTTTQNTWRQAKVAHQLSATA